MESRSNCAVESHGVERDRAPIGPTYAGQGLTLSLTPDAHSYEKPGRCRLVVPVVDIFGNDTPQTCAVDVK